MKVFFSIVFIVFEGLIVKSQDTLREMYTNGYSIKFILHNDQKFQYIFRHDVGTNYGEGVYKKRCGKIIFDFRNLKDSILKPELSIATSDHLFFMDEIRIVMRKRKGMDTYTEIAWDEDRKKPWIKHKRKVKLNYAFISAIKT